MPGVSLPVFIVLAALASAAEAEPPAPPASAPEAVSPEAAPSAPPSPDAEPSEAAPSDAGPPEPADSVAEDSEAEPPGEPPEGAESHAAEPVAAPPEPPLPPVTIVASVGVEGDFADLTCDREPNEPAFSAVAARLASVPEALKLDAGDLFGTSAPARILLERMPEQVVSAIVSTGLRALALGREDIAAPRPAFLQFSAALRAAGVPYLLSNLVCQPGAAKTHPPLCDSVLDSSDPPLILEVGDERIAVVTVLSPDALATAAKDRTEGITLQKPAEALAAQTKRARAAGATSVVAIYEPDRNEPLKDTLELSVALGATGPDLLLVNRISSALTAALPPGSRTRIVATRRNSVVRHVLGQVEPDEPPRAEPPPEVTALDRQGTTLLCRELSRGYPGGKLSTPLHRDAFTSLLLDLMRTRADADVAIINRGAIGNGGLFPIRKVVTPLQLYAALPFENRLMVTRMRGPALRSWATSANAALFASRGLTVVDGEVKVNGRPVSDALTYEVTTTDFVAEGGHGGLGEGLEFEQVGAQTVRELLSEFLSIERSVDPRKVLPDPADSTRWVFRYSLDGAFTSTNVHNPQTRFSDPQLARVPAVTLRIDTEGRADADDPSYTFENGVRLRYATVSTDAPDAPTGFVENLDVITGRSTLTLRYLRPEKARWYHPLPFIETYVESEIDRPETREYHHLELRPIAGARLDLADRLALYLGVGGSWEVLARREQMVPPGAPAVPVAVAGWILRPRPIFTLADRVIEADSTLDLVYRDPFGNAGVQLRANVKFSVPIFRAVALTLGYDFFGRYAPAGPDAEQTFGTSGDILLGLKVSFWEALQTR